MGLKGFLQNGHYTMTEKERRDISAFIENEFGIKMPPEKKALLVSRLSKRLSHTGASTFSDYFEYIQSSEGLMHEIHIFADLVSTHETSFFREQAHFESLQSEVLPNLIKEQKAGIERPLRVLSCACSTGEEVYSLACIIEEYALARGLDRLDYRITGTDISLKVLETARRAVYPSGRVKNVPAHIFRRYFMRSRDREAAHVRIIPELRAGTEFFQLNLMSQYYPFPDPFDIIFFRNALIYFERERQIQICSRLISNLREGGYFFVGHSESIAGFDLPVRTVRPTIYRKK